MCTFVHFSVMMAVAVASFPGPERKFPSDLEVCKAEQLEIRKQTKSLQPLYTLRCIPVS